MKVGAICKQGTERVPVGPVADCSTPAYAGNRYRQSSHYGPVSQAVNQRSPALGDYALEAVNQSVLAMSLGQADAAALSTLALSLIHI